MKELNSGLTFFESYEQKMVADSGNTGSVSLIGPNVIWDRALGRSFRSKKGFSDPRNDAKSGANCARFEADQAPDGVKDTFSRIPDSQLRPEVII